MIPTKYYTFDNVNRAKQVMIAALALSALLSVFCIWNSLSALFDLRRAETSLASNMTQVSDISRKVAEAEKNPLPAGLINTNGIDSVALQLSEWASKNGAMIDTITPEGSPQTLEIKNGNMELGTWQSEKVRISGSARFLTFLDMIHWISDSKMTVRVDSFSISSGTNESGVTGHFDMLITILYRQNKQGTPNDKV